MIVTDSCPEFHVRHFYSCVCYSCHKLVMSSFQLVSLPAFRFQKSGDTDLMVSTAISKSDFCPVYIHREAEPSSEQHGV